MAAASGGLLATAVLPASAAPRGVVEGVAAVSGDTAADSSLSDLLAVDLPAVPEPADRPVVAASAPSQSADALSFGVTGFEGIAPPPEPETPAEPEPEPETEATETQTETTTQSGTTTESQSSGSASQQGSTTTSSTETRSQTSASRTETREQAPSSSAPAPSGGVLSAAASLVGIPYKWAGSSPSTGFDCSGFTSYAFAQVGVSLPRTAAAQQSYATPVSSPQPGDLVFWGYPAYHVGIYAGNGMVYDAGRSGLAVDHRSMFSGVSGYGRVG